LTCGGCSSAAPSSWAKPRIEFIGVRNSWLMRLRNSLFARFARSASSRACSASVVARRSALSAARCSVMSRALPTTPAAVAPSINVRFTDSISRHVPSAWRAR
jgi:hypothetical protein